MENETELKIDFLKTAISDTQELIRYTENKAAFIITILGGMLVYYFSFLNEICNNYEILGKWFWATTTLFFTFYSICIIILVKLIKPIIVPIDNLIIENVNKPKLIFFLGKNNYGKSKFIVFRNSKEFKLDMNFEDYFNTLLTSSSDSILKTLTFEVFKLSYIRNIKNDRFNILIKFLIYTVFFFVITIIFFNLTVEISDKENIFQFNTHKFPH
jgi:hypothetical protein